MTTPSTHTHTTAQAEPTSPDELLIEQWTRWQQTRRYYVPTATHGRHTIGGHSGNSTHVLPEPDDTVCSAKMHALNRAITAQPRDQLETQAFLLYYVQRVRPIKTIADYLGISRQHCYRLQKQFVTRVMVAARQIEAEERAAAEYTPATTTPANQAQAAPAWAGN